MRAHRVPALAGLLILAACGGSSSSTCNPVAQTGCQAPAVCEAVAGGSAGCFDPVVITGAIHAFYGGAPVPGARVVALDENRAPRSDVDTTDAAGAFSITVRATRDAAGAPVAATATLRADAQGYQTFPSGIRTALPLHLAPVAAGDAVRDAAGHRWVVSGPLTALELLPSGNQESWITGTLAPPPGAAGALVVGERLGCPAGQACPAVTSVADAGGHYTLFNVLGGQDYRVSAYAKGTNYVPVDLTNLAVGENTASALLASPVRCPSVTGDLGYRNLPTKPAVQVSLAVASTYDPVLARGESPPGLTVTGGQAGYIFTGVPNGAYLVLSAFGHEGAVRDPQIAPIPVTVAGGVVTLAPDGFFNTRAIDLTAIDGQPVTGEPIAVAGNAAPVFTWTRENTYASTQAFWIEVFDALGGLMWRASQGDVGGENSATYAGLPLDDGMTYQVRITAVSSDVPWDQLQPADYISVTEDVLGVFTFVSAPTPP